MEELGIRCVSKEIDTDQYGTFSGEVERTGSVLEVLVQKTQEVFKRVSEARLALASEGTFGPHPHIGFISSDHEALLLVDRELDLQIYAEEISFETNLAEKNLRSVEELDSFLKKVQFPSHGLIVQPLENQKMLFKGITDFNLLEEAIRESIRHSPSNQAKVTTDMRAHFNPTRMKVIEQAGRKLVKRLSSFCKGCGLLGFWPIKHIEGLVCSECGQPSSAVKEYLWGCLKCSYQETRPREDGKIQIDPAQCQWCNP